MTIENILLFPRLNFNSMLTIIVSHFSLKFISIDNLNDV